MRTLHVNLFAGPGTGKSTTASGIFYYLKAAGLKCELIREFAKDLVWREDKSINDQVYVFGKQYHKHFILENKVDVTISDSPLLLSLIYAPANLPDSWRTGVIDLFHQFNNLNFFLVRDDTEHKFEQAGRLQDLEGAIEKDKQIKEMLDHYQIQYQPIIFTKNLAENIASMIQVILKEK